MNPYELINPCLGLDFLGTCKEQASFFGLGVVITFIGLLLTASQLATSTYKLRIRYNGGLKKIFVFLISFAVLFSIISTLIPFIPGIALPLIGYREFWEFSGAILALLSIVVLLIMTLKPIIINRPRKLNKFINIVIRDLSRGKIETDTLAEELSYCFPSLLNMASSNNVEAINCIRLLHDTNLLKSISNRPDTLNTIFKQYDLIKIPEKWSISFLKDLIFQSLSNEDSIISRELTGSSFSQVNSGDGIFVNFLLNESRIFLGFDLLTINIYQGNSVLEKNYFSLWRKSLYSLFKKEITYSSAKFSRNIKGLFDNIILSLNRSEEIDFHSFGDSYDLATFFELLASNSEKLLGFRAENFPKPIVNEDNQKDTIESYREYQNNHLADIIVFSIAKIMESLWSKRSSDKNNGFFVRIALMNIARYFDNAESSMIMIAIRERWEIYLLDRIKKNLYGFYPMWLPIFFTIYGYQIFQLLGENKPLTPFYLEIMSLLDKYFKRISMGYVHHNQTNITPESLERSKQVMKDLLPENMNYDIVNNTLKYFYGSNEYFTEIKLDDLSVVKTEETK